MLQANDLQYKEVNTDANVYTIPTLTCVSTLRQASEVIRA